MSEDKVVYLAFRNEKMPTDGVEILACATCRNKTFTVTYDGGEFPVMKCSVCGGGAGRIGWANVED